MKDFGYGGNGWTGADGLSLVIEASAAAGLGRDRVGLDPDVQGDGLITLSGKVLVVGHRPLPRDADRWVMWHYESRSHREIGGGEKSVATTRHQAREMIDAWIARHR